MFVAGDPFPFVVEPTHDHMGTHDHDGRTVSLILAVLGTPIKKY